jgi:phosphate transport system substrate-binding protein
MRAAIITATAAASFSVVTSVYAANITGAGGTAIYPLLSQWAQTYAKLTGNDVNYQEIGSGGGIEQIENKTVLFANSDMPLKPDILAKENLVQFPQVIISITPVVHLAGIKAGELVFDGSTLPMSISAKSKRGTTRPFGSSIRMPSCRTRPSPRFIAPMGRERPLISPITCPR